MGFSVCETTSRLVVLKTAIAEAEKSKLTYTYSVSTGRIEGTGATVNWNLDEALIGEHTVTVTVKDAMGRVATAALSVRIVECSSCDAPEVFIRACPAVVVECPTEIESGKLISFVATVTGGDPNIRPSYIWTTDAGRIVSGKYEKKLTVDLLGFPFEKVTATVSAGGADPSCAAEVSCTTRITQ